MPLPKTRSQVADRKDPPQRKLEGYHSTSLKNADPSKKYIFANVKDQDTGVEYYTHLGFEVVHATEGGVRMVIKAPKLGEPIEYRGCYLMEADAEELKARWLHEQQQADLLEKRIVSNRTGVDPMRGLNRGVLERGELQIVNETKELVTE